MHGSIRNIMVARRRRTNVDVSQKRPDESEVCIVFVLYGMGVSRCWLHDDVASLLRLTGGMCPEDDEVETRQ
jgi:hypothetical protein